MESFKLTTILYRPWASVTVPFPALERTLTASSGDFSVISKTLPLIRTCEITGVDTINKITLMNVFVNLFNGLVMLRY